MWNKRLLLTTASALMLLGCNRATPAVEAAPTPTDAPAATPALTATPIPEQELVVAPRTPVPTMTPPPTPEPTPAPTATPAPTPAPTDTPEPTDTPDPYAGQKRVNHRKDDRFFYVTLTDELKARITGMSYPAAGEPCRVSYDDLRYVRVLYVDFDGAEQEGELMVHRQVADDVIDIFYKLYQKRYRLASVKLVDDFGQPGDDGNSMRANNTSAFCYRQVTGTKHLSWHSFGAAIDINPLQNPYMNKGRVSPEEAREFLDRKDKRPHMIDHSDYCYKVFHAHGWKWGGDWSGDKDYQHFYKELKGVKR